MVAVSSASHYFDADPSAPERRRTVRTRLGGRDVEVQTANGIFSPDGLDKGTAALFSAVPAPPATGRFLDVGAGWGPIALTLGVRSPEAEVTAVEVNDRSLQLTRDNAAALGLGNVVALRPEDVPEDAAFDLIWSNPPVRIGKDALHELLLSWLALLSADGEAWLVVLKNLGADSLATWLTGQGWDVSRQASSKGFRVLRVRRGPDGPVDG